VQKGLATRLNLSPDWQAVIKTPLILPLSTPRVFACINEGKSGTIDDYGWGASTAAEFFNPESSQLGDDS
jgi:hypothetical protein